MKPPMLYFSNLEDPRIDRTKAHPLENILFITIAAVICGAESWNDIEAYGHAKENWLKKHLNLANGIPSHDTFNRFFSLVDTQKLENCFLEWVQDIAQITQGEIVSIDGKSIRGSKKSASKHLVHMVSAWANKNQLSLGQIKTEEKSNEITAIPKLLNVLSLEGCTVTIDAMGCQKNIAKQIIEKGANYVLAVKGNQKELKENIEASTKILEPFEEWEEIDAGHGRVETRKCSIYKDLSLLRREWDWEGLQALVKLESIRYHKANGQEERETRYYITSLQIGAGEIGSIIRNHWGIENQLHWALDVSFGEDHSRKRDGHSAENFSIINRIALNILKNDHSKKRSIRGKRLDAGWDNGYLIRLLLN